MRRSDDRQKRTDLAARADRLDRAFRTRLDRLADRLAALDRTRQTLGYTETLKRGYAVVRAEGRVVTDKARAEKAAALEIEFHDGMLPVATGATGAGVRTKREKDTPPGGQGSLF
jgi:exodeoxyribonuclease VII large subunit